jgi:ribose 5-phosphate isomerase
VIEYVANSPALQMFLGLATGLGINYFIEIVGDMIKKSS